MRELFVYYRVSDDRAAAAATAVQHLQAALRGSVPALQARLLRRPSGGGDAASAQTWMETYALPGVGIDAELEARIAAAAAVLATFIEGERHVEIFEPLEPSTAR